MIHQILKSFPNLNNDFIYSNIYVETHHFNSLQHYIDKSIQDQNAKWLELHVKPSLHCSMHPLVNIIYSSPALNTFSHKRALQQNVNPANAQQQAINQGETTTFSISSHFPTTSTINWSSGY